MYFVFDGTFDGLLTAVFEWFERKPGVVRLCLRKDYQPQAFSVDFFIETSDEKSKRVWHALIKKLGKNAIRKFWFAFLSEQSIAFNHLFNYAIDVFSTSLPIENNYRNADVLAISKFEKSVEREKHRMEAFIRFKEEQELYYSIIEPDFNVLPLIKTHFKDRFSDQNWLIYDQKRKYGLFYNQKIVEEVTLDLKIPNKKTLDAANDYENLWKDYFKNTNIIPRKNTQLHTKHIPKRYWKYLTEKEFLHNNT